jgi:tetratricopeptide (TPR) repeat protein
MDAFLRKWLPHMAMPMLLLITAIVYFPVVDSNFVVWDDLDLIVHNALVAGFHPSVFWSFDPELYAPLTLLTFQFEHWLVGFEPTLYHVTNVLLHLGNTYLVYMFTMSVVGDGGRGAQKVSALVSAALFALHPVQVETVAWASGRKELLWTLFGLLALSNHVRTPQVRTIAMDRYLSQKHQTLLWIFLAMLSKPTAIVLPVLIIAMECARGGELVSAVRQQRRALGLAALFGAVALLGKSSADIGLSLLQRLVLVCGGFVASLRLVVWPRPLAALHPAPDPIALTSLPYAAALLGCIVLALGIWRLRTKVPRTTLSVAFITLPLVLGLLAPIHAQTVTLLSEHYLYFPMVGVAMLVMLLLSTLWNSFSSIIVRSTETTIMIAILVLFAWMTVDQIPVWRDSSTLFESVRKTYPRSVAVLTNLGTAYAQMEQYAEAESVLRQAIGIEPDAIQARFNYAGLRYVRGNYAAATEEYKRVLERAPDHQDAMRMLVWSYYRSGDSAKAAEVYDNLIHQNPSLRSQLPDLSIPPDNVRSL